MGTSFGARVKELREALGLTQKEVAERSGGLLTREYVGVIEGGHNKGTSWKVRSGLARAFCIDPELLTSYATHGYSTADVIAKAVRGRKKHAPKAEDVGLVGFSLVDDVRNREIVRQSKTGDVTEPVVMPGSTFGPDMERSLRDSLIRNAKTRVAARRRARRAIAPFADRLLPAPSNLEEQIVNEKRLRIWMAVAERLAEPNSESTGEFLLFFTDAMVAVLEGTVAEINDIIDDHGRHSSIAFDLYDGPLDFLHAFVPVPRRTLEEQQDIDRRREERFGTPDPGAIRDPDDEDEDDEDEDEDELDEADEGEAEGDDGNRQLTVADIEKIAQATKKQQQ
jgi:hypothetical protein